jgi:nicotinamidase/pyrazinamidase
MAKAALIVVDVQRDFCEGGALAATDTLSLLQPLQECIEAARRANAVIVYTKDWHPADHSSFQASGGPWPVHCAADTPGAELMPPLHPAPGEIIVHKGVERHGPGYSGFELTGLEKRLRAQQVTRVAICGIATEYCVHATAKDGLQSGFETVVLRDLIRAVQPAEASRVLQELEQAGAKTVTASAWLASLKANP